MLMQPTTFQSAPSRGEGDARYPLSQEQEMVSIRALPWGGRPEHPRCNRGTRWFQSAPSRGEGDDGDDVGRPDRPVSIRALPWGGRLRAVEPVSGPDLFQSAPSRGEGDPVRASMPSLAEFQSAPSRGEGDHSPMRRLAHIPFQSAPSRGEGDGPTCTRDTGPNLFQSAPSRGEGDRHAAPSRARFVVSIRALPWGGRRSQATTRDGVASFNPRPPVGRATP